MPDRDVFLSLKHLSKSFKDGGSDCAVLSDLNLTVQRGEILALAGESGSGKSTLARCMLRLVEADKGEMWHNGENLLALPVRVFRKRFRSLQMIFQNPALALNPLLSVHAALSEVVRVVQGLKGAKAEECISGLLNDVGLDERLLASKPAKLSGGEKQRLVIARALAAQPHFLIADEPTASLDASHRRTILDLLVKLSRRHGLTILLITHDIGAVLDVADRLAVLKEGRIVETDVLDNGFAQRPHHAYTRELLEAALLPVDETENRDALVLA